MTIIYFAPISYGFLMQRPQYIARELSKEHDVYYIEPTKSLIRRVLRRGESYKRSWNDLSDSLHVVKLDGLLSTHRMFDFFDPLGLNIAWEWRQLSKTIPKPDIVWIGYCGWYPVTLRYNSKFIYDRMDNNALLVNNKLLRKQLMRTDHLLMQSADCVFTTARGLYDEALTLNKHVHLIPNAVAEEFVPMNIQQNRIGEKKIFGYAGMIDDWFDKEAIMRIIDADEKNEVVLAGPNNTAEIRHERVKYLGRVSKDCLAELLSEFDVCLYPFKMNMLVETINAVKIYEYLAFNKPILAVDSMETRGFGDLVKRYQSYKELDDICVKLLNPPFSSDEARVQFINENCWEQRVKVIQEVLRVLV